MQSGGEKFVQEFSNSEPKATTQRADDSAVAQTGPCIGLVARVTVMPLLTPMKLVFVLLGEHIFWTIYIIQNKNFACFMMFTLFSLVNI